MSSHPPLTGWKVPPLCSSRYSPPSLLALLCFPVPWHLLETPTVKRPVQKIPFLALEEHIQTEADLPRSLLEKPGARLHGLPPTAKLKTTENRNYRPHEPLVRGAQLASRTATQAAVIAKGRKLRERAESGTDLPQITAPQARKHCSNTRALCRRQLFSKGQHRAVEEASVPCLQPPSAEDNTRTLKPHTRGRRIAFRRPTPPEWEHTEQMPAGIPSPQSNGLVLPGALHLILQNSSGTQRGFHRATLPRTRSDRQHHLSSRCPSAFSAKLVVSTH